MALPPLKRRYFGGFTGDMQKSDWKKSITILLKNKSAKHSVIHKARCCRWMAAGTAAHTLLCRAAAMGVWLPEGPSPFLPGPLVPTHGLSMTRGPTRGYNTRSPEGPRGARAGARSAPRARVAPARPFRRGPAPPQPVLTSWYAGTRR